MGTSELSANLLNAIKKEGCRGKIVSVEHLQDLNRDINTLHQQDLFDEKFFAEELNGFDFSASERFPEAKSLFIVAAPQPSVRVTFKPAGKKLPCIIPPTYSYETDRKMEDLFRLQLEPAGYRVKKAVLPWKLLAVRSGLARYGKNNITYIEGLGSFYRLVAFVSDWPSAEDSWGELQTLKDCWECDACTKACPSGAIGSDRFLLHAERCITFHNERQGAFPPWLNPAWHHCLVGCMVCQKVCPANRNLRKRVVEGPVFSAEETAYLRPGIRQNKLPLETVQKLNQLDMMGYLSVLGRNLQALISKQRL